MNPLGIAGGVLGGLADIGKFFFGLHQNHLANQIHPVFNQYQTSPYAKQQLGIAQQMYGGRMAGAGAMEQNIAANQANYVNGAQRNATDSAQLLSLAGQAQGQTNNAYQNLQTKEAQNKYNMLDNLNHAYNVMINEGDKTSQSMLDKYQMDIQQQQGLRNGSAQNMFGALGDLSGGLIQAGSLFGKPQASYGSPNYTGE
jgi:hypothetical protein